MLIFPGDILRGHYCIMTLKYSLRILLIDKCFIGKMSLSILVNLYKENLLLTGRSVGLPVIIKLLTDMCWWDSFLYIVFTEKFAFLILQIL